MAKQLIQLTDGVNDLYPTTPTKDISSSFFTLTATGVELNASVCIKVGSVISLRLGIKKTDNGAFAQGRINLGTLSNEAKPLLPRYAICAASNSVNSYMNRSFGAIVNTDGSVIADNFFYSDVKQFYFIMEYVHA